MPPSSAPVKRGFLARQAYTYELWTGLYMLDPWEKRLFNSLVGIACACSCYVIAGWYQDAMASKA